MSKRVFWSAKSGFEDPRATNQMESTLLTLAQAIANLEAKTGIEASEFKQFGGAQYERTTLAKRNQIDATGLAGYQIRNDADTVLVGSVNGEDTYVYLPSAREVGKGKQIYIKVYSATYTQDVYIYQHPSTDDRIDGVWTNVSVPVVAEMAWEDRPALLFESDGVSRWFHLDSLRRDTGDANPAHAPQHKHGGGDEVATATPATNSIPKTGGAVTLGVGWYPDMTGDAGSGGTKGAVPAPGAGDTAAGKFLKADASWAAPVATTARVTVLDVQPMSFGNQGAGEDTLKTYTMPGGTLVGADNDSVRITAWGKISGDSDDATIRIYFGATVVVSIGILRISAIDWWAQATVTAETGSAQEACAGIVIEGSVCAALVTSPGENPAGAIVIKCTGQNNTDADNNRATCSGWVVEKLEAP